MIVEKNKIDTELFLSLFYKKFENFCRRTPFFISFDLSDTKVVLYHYKDSQSKKEKIYEYEFDFTKKPEGNIFDIKQYLIKYFYPKMTEIEKEEKIYEHTKINQMISEGEITLDEVTPNGGIIEKKEITWVIEKVIVDRDELHIRNLENWELRVYQSKIPVSKLIEKFTSGKIKSLFERWKYFITKTKYLGHV